MITVPISSCTVENDGSLPRRDSFEDPEKTYSAGMRLRLGFTTALMTRVDILLFDEVLEAYRKFIIGNFQ